MWWAGARSGGGGVQVCLAWWLGGVVLVRTGGSDGTGVWCVVV